MSYTDSMSEDYVGGSNQNLKKVYQTIYVDRLGARFSNMLITCYMQCDSHTFTDILKHVMWYMRKCVSGSLLRNIRSCYNQYFYLQKCFNECCGTCYQKGC